MARLSSSSPFLLISFIAAFVSTYNIIISMYGEGRVSLHHTSERIGDVEGLIEVGDGEGLIGEDGEVLRGRKGVEGAGAVHENGIVKIPKEKKLKNMRPLEKFRTAMTCDSSGYSKWQSRIMHFYYKKFQAMEGGEEMGPFTRVLHTGEKDELMDEIPTFIVDPLPEGMDKGYIVLNRPWAFVQWIEKHQFPEKYIWMAEPDHIITRPIPNFAAAMGGMPSAFPFFYITPGENKKILRKWFPVERGPISKIDPIGNSPVIISRDQLRRIAPVWHNVTLEMKNDKAADDEFGWVLEMYGYATAAAMEGVSHNLNRRWMIQPPWDVQIGENYLIHYTYGCDFNLKGEVMPGKVGPWHFDKRDFETSPPRNLTLPPAGTSASVVQLITMINDATWSIPGWKAGVA